MFAERGGYAVQRKYYLEGRTGLRHPAHYAAKVSVARRKRLKWQSDADRKRSAVAWRTAGRVVPSNHPAWEEISTDRIAVHVGVERQRLNTESSGVICGSSPGLLSRQKVRASNTLKTREFIESQVRAGVENGSR
jgi:hypothetical protein